MIPVLTSLAGTCLTSQNWQDVGINTAAFYLDALLMKPGFDLLNNLSDLSSYVSWQNNLVLNATLPKINSDGIYKIHSHYDGSSISYTEDEIIKLIAKLKPNIVIMPNGISEKNITLCNDLLSNIMIFLPANDLLNSLDKSYGVYLTYDDKKSFQELLQEIEQYKNLPCYVAGNLNLQLMQELQRHNVKYIESNLAALDAYNGKVYSSNKDIEIFDPKYAMEFEPIDESCVCPTCSQKLTKAYLHHLYANTPLLCQRFLIEHNIHFCQKNLTP